MMTGYTLFAVVIYFSWKILNVFEKYKYDNNRMTKSNVFTLVFTCLMCYWLIKPSVLFLIAKLIDGIFALCLGLYISMLPISSSHFNHKDKVVNGYWGYAITDLIICIICFLVAVLGGTYV